MSERPLGRRIAPNDDHIRKYGIRSAAMPVPSTPTPLVVGIAWYTNFDEPVWDARHRIWRIGSGSLGSVRGGHCVDVPSVDANDLRAWWAWYNQLAEGKCVGEGSCRQRSQRRRKRFDPTALWNRAKEIDPWPDTNPGDDNGTDVNSAMKILKAEGPRPVRAGVVLPPSLADGIAAYYWAETVEDMQACLADPRIERYDAFPLDNSWGDDGARIGDRWDGRGYPHTVWLARETMRRLLGEDAEVAVPVDR